MSTSSGGVISRRPVPPRHRPDGCVPSPQADLNTGTPIALDNSPVEMPATSLRRDMGLN
jgi:hypothetical protein